MNNMSQGTKMLPLSQAQIEAYDRDGFIIVENVLTGAEVEALRDVLERPEVFTAMGRHESTTTDHYMELTVKHPAFLALAKHPNILAAIVPLIGASIQIQHSKLAMAPRAIGQGGFGWHQDFAYYPHSNTDLLAVFVYLDDTDLGNAGMTMLAGSHKLGLLNHVDENGVFAGKCLEPEHWEHHPERVTEIRVRAGGISVHHALTLHGSGVNRSGKPRRGLVFSYRAADAYQYAGMVYGDNGLQVCGQPTESVRSDGKTYRIPERGRKGERNFGTAWHQAGEFATAQNRARNPTV